MPFEYISTEDAIAADGLRMVVVSNVPSPWGEAAKGILHMKGISWKAVRLVYDSDAFNGWAKDQTGPIAIYNQEAPRSGWREILDLAERLAPDPSLMATDKESMLRLCDDLIGENGLGWARRLQLVEAGLNGEGGFPQRSVKYLGDKYGYTAESRLTCDERVHDILAQLSDRLIAQRAAGSAYFFGDRPSAADIYCAAVIAMFAPLPEADCAMKADIRAAFNTIDDATAAALDPLILEHRDHIYAEHLELPLSL